MCRRLPDVQYDLFFRSLCFLRARLLPWLRERAPSQVATSGRGGGWTEVCGQQKQSNDPGNNQHILNTPIIGRR